MRVVLISVEGVFADIADAAVCCRWVVVGTGGGFPILSYSLQTVQTHSLQPWRVAKKHCASTLQRFQNLS